MCSTEWMNGDLQGKSLWTTQSPGIKRSSYFMAQILCEHISCYVVLQGKPGGGGGIQIMQVQTFKSNSMAHKVLFKTTSEMLVKLKPSGFAQWWLFVLDQTIM